MKDQPDTSPGDGITRGWLKGATYTIDIDKQEMIVDVPNSFTVKRFTFCGEDQCDLVQSLLNELGVGFNQSEDRWSDWRPESLDEGYTGEQDQG